MQGIASHVGRRPKALGNRRSGRAGEPAAGESVGASASLDDVPHRPRLPSYPPVGPPHRLPDLYGSLSTLLGIRWYRSSGLLERGFCGDCGASLFWKFDAGDRLIFALGNLDDTDGFGVALHMFVEEKGGYYDLEGDTMKMTGGEYRQRLEMGAWPPPELA